MDFRFYSLVKHLTINKIVMLAFLILLLLLLIIATIFYTFNVVYKKRKNQILKDLQYFKNINIQEKLKRMSIIAHYNKNYEHVFSIWAKRYKNLLDNNFWKINSSFVNIINFEKTNKFKLRNSLINETFKYSKKTKIMVQKLVIEIDYFISSDQLFREYQLFFNQKFLFLKKEIVKLNFQEQFDQHKINDILNIIESKLQFLDTNIIEGKFELLIDIFTKIDIALTTLANILQELPNINFHLDKNIPERIMKLKENLDKLQENKFLDFYNNLNVRIKQQTVIIKNLIDDLQYKKANKILKEILKSLDYFQEDIKEEEKFSTFFQQKYQEFNLINLNLNQIFDQINNDFNKINREELGEENNDKLRVLNQAIKKDISVLNILEKRLYSVVDKQSENLSYQQILELLSDIIEKNIFIFDKLDTYNQLLIKKIDKKLIIESSCNKIKSIVLQLQNLFDNLKFSYLQEKFCEKFLAIQKKFQQVEKFIETSNKNNYDLVIEKLKIIENEIFSLYQEIKITYSIWQLSYSTLEYSNRLRKNNAESKSNFEEIDNLIAKESYEQALIKLIKLIN